MARQISLSSPELLIVILHCFVCINVFSELALKHSLMFFSCSSPFHTHLFNNFLW